MAILCDEPLLRSVCTTMTQATKPRYSLSEWKAGSQKLSQRTEELSQIVREQLRLLHRRKVSALGHHRPSRNVQAAFRQRPWRHGNLLGEDCHYYRQLDSVAARQTERLLARLEIQARGRSGHLCHPADHDVGQNFVASKNALDLPCTIALRSKLFDDPCCKSHRRIVQTVTGCLWLGRLFMAITALCIPPSPKLPQIRLRNLFLRFRVQRAPEQKTPAT
jgi:hypothetical protein